MIFYFFCYVFAAHTPQERHFLKVQAEFIRAAGRVQICVNIVSTPRFSSAEANRHFEIMRTSLHDIYRIFYDLNDDFLRGEAYQSLCGHLIEIQEPITTYPAQGFLEFLKQMFEQKGRRLYEGELSIRYRTLPNDLQGFDGLVQSYNTTQQKATVVLKMKQLIESIRIKLSYLEKGGYNNLQRFQEDFRRKEQIAKRCELDVQFNRFESLQTGYSGAPDKTVEQMRSCIDDIRKISATFPNSPDQKQKIERYERFLRPREFKYHMDKIDILGKRYFNDSQKGPIIAEMLRHIEAMRELLPYISEQSQQFKQKEHRFRQYEANMKQRESLKGQIQVCFTRFDKAKMSYEDSVQQKGFSASEMRRYIGELRKI